MLTMRSVIGLEIVVGIGHKALQLTTQQQIGQHITRVVGQFVSSAIAHSNRDMLGITRRLEVQVYLLEWLVGPGGGIHSNSCVVVVMMVNKEQTVGQGLSCFVEYHQVVDTRWQVGLVDNELLTACNRLEILKNATTEHGHAILLGIGQSTQLDIRFQLTAHSIQMQGASHLLRLWQVDGITLAMPHELGRKSSTLRHLDSEASTSLMRRTDGQTILPVRNTQEAADVLLLPFLIKGLEGHRTGLPSNQMSAFRIEVHSKSFLEFLLSTRLRSAHNILA